MTSDASLSSRMLHRRHGIFQIRGLPTLELLRSVQHTAPPAGKQMSVPLSNQAYDIYIYAFSRHFYPKRLTIAFRLYIFINMCVPWESNPQLFALLTQCSTTEPQEHIHSIQRYICTTDFRIALLCFSKFGTNRFQCTRNVSR